MNKQLPAAFLLGAGVGFLSAAALHRRNAAKPLRPERVLERVREIAQTQFSIDGAWICVSPRVWIRDRLHYTVYQGGLLVKHQDNDRHFDFIADAASGVILECKPQQS